jgi:hypothetical protein
VGLFRKNPGEISLVARESGLSPTMVRKAWNDGWQNAVLAHRDKPAIRGVIANEMVAAQAILAKDDEFRKKVTEDAHAAMEHVAKERAATGHMVKLAKDNAIELLLGTKHLIQINHLLIHKLNQLTSDPEWAPKTREVNALLRTVSEVAERNTETANTVDELERKFLGDPSDRGKGPTLSIEQAIITINQSTRASQRLQQRAKQGKLPDNMRAIIATQALDVASYEDGDEGEDDAETPEDVVDVDAVDADVDVSTD